MKKSPRHLKLRADEIENVLVERLQSDLDEFLREETFDSSACASIAAPTVTKENRVWLYTSVSALFLLALSGLFYWSGVFNGAEDVVEFGPGKTETVFSEDAISRNSLIFSTTDVVNFSKDKLSAIEENVESIFVLPVSFSTVGEGTSNDESEGKQLKPGYEDDVWNLAYSAVYSDGSVLRFDPLIRSLSFVLASRDPAVPLE